MPLTQAFQIITQFSSKITFLSFKAMMTGNIVRIYEKFSHFNFLFIETGFRDTLKRIKTLIYT